MHGINWGDVPTWLAVVVATVGGYAALRQLRLQQEDIRRQTVQLERQQAEQIVFTTQRSQRANSDDLSWIVMGIVENNSARPIRQVECLTYAGDNPDPVEIGELLPAGVPPGAYLFAEAQTGAFVGVIRAGQRFGFKFDVPWTERGRPVSVAYFTDDTGLRWIVDSNMHLGGGNEKPPVIRGFQRVSLLARYALLRRSRRTPAQRPGPPAAH